MAPTCLGGSNGAPIQDGFSGTDHVGLTSDGINHLYVAINGQGVYRYTISSGAMTGHLTTMLAACSGLSTTVRRTRFQGRAATAKSLPKRCPRSRADSYQLADLSGDLLLHRAEEGPDAQRFP